LDLEGLLLLENLVVLYYQLHLEILEHLVGLSDLDFLEVLYYQLVQ
jgi:hypothetical protein